MVEAKGLQTYQQYSEVRSSLVEISSELNTLVDGFDVSTETKNSLNRVKNIVENDNFRVMVVGGFSRGKSTMINALLGRNVLPAKLTPTTAVITIIKYSDEQQALVRYKDGTQEIVPIEDLKKHLVIPRDGLRQSNYENRIETAVDKVELRYPLPLCRDGVEIIDSPGLEEDETRQKITLHYLNHADAAVVLLSCQQLLTLEERRFIRDELKARGYDHLFYLVNFCDEIEHDERDDITYRAMQELGHSERLFLISSRTALQAKIHHDEAMLEQSNFSSFEQALERFLVNEKGNSKLTNSARLIKGALTELKELLSLRLSMLEKKSVEDIEHLEAEAQARRAEILNRSESVIEFIGEKGAHIGDKIVADFRRKVYHIGQELRTVVADMGSGETVISAFLERKEMAKATEAYLRSYIQEQLSEWCQEEVPELIEFELRRMQDKVQKELDIILQSIHELKVQLNPELSPVFEESDSLQRILIAAGGLLIGDVGTAITGGALGIQGMLFHLGAVLVAQYALFIVGLLNPVTAVLASLGLAGGMILTKGDDIVTSIRTKVADSIRPQLESLPDEKERELREGIFVFMNQLSSNIETGIDAMLNDIMIQVSSAKADIQTGKEVAVSNCLSIVARIAEIEQKLELIHLSWSGGVKHERAAGS